MNHCLNLNIDESISQNNSDLSARRMLRFFICLCFLNSLQYSEGTVNLDPEQKQQIDDFINALLLDCPKHNVAGMNLAVVYQGETRKNYRIWCQRLR